MKKYCSYCGAKIKTADEVSTEAIPANSLSEAYSIIDKKNILVSAGTPYKPTESGESDRVITMYPYYEGPEDEGAGPPSAIYDPDKKILTIYYTKDVLDFIRDKKEYEKELWGQ